MRRAPRCGARSRSHSVRLALRRERKPSRLAMSFPAISGARRIPASAIPPLIVSACARSPVTAWARLARSLVVATTRMLPAVAVWATSERPSTHKRTRTARGRHRPRALSLRSDLSRRSPFRNEDALRQQAVHVLLGIRDRAEAAIHRDAGKPVGVEARDLLFGFEPLDHAHR